MLLLRITKGKGTSINNLLSNKLKKKLEDTLWFRFRSNKRTLKQEEILKTIARIFKKAIKVKSELQCREKFRWKRLIMRDKSEKCSREWLKPTMSSKISSTTSTKRIKKLVRKINLTSILYSEETRKSLLPQDLQQKMSTSMVSLTQTKLL